MEFGAALDEIGGRNSFCGLRRPRARAASVPSPGRVVVSEPVPHPEAHPPVEAAPRPEPSPTVSLPTQARSTPAQRVMRRTTDLLAIAILLIGGLMVGGRLSKWWATDPADTPSPMEVAQAESGAPAHWGDDGQPVTLEFGPFAQALRRQELRGTTEEITRQLTDWCRNTVQQSDLPSAVPDARETALLKQLKTLPAVATLPNRGTVYRADYPVSMVLGTRLADGRNGGKTEDVPAERVVCWGFAFPQRPGVWTVFLSGPGEAARQLSPLPSIELPKHCERLISLRNDRGDALLAFTGADRASVARRHFEEWFQARGWAVGRAWNEVNGRWSARFVSPPGDAPQAGWEGSVDLQLGDQGNGGVSGVLNFTPRPRS